MDVIIEVCCDRRAVLRLHFAVEVLWWCGLRHFCVQDASESFSHSHQWLGSRTGI